ncbi:MAG: aminomethyl-transferring glycine dehydrogenase [Oceanospirillaceae bacterium]|jgi:glycine dehydrogenase|nr:aminomethyl-transferring glycine dehydrogenase [Oceanospirillaceae bacterium]MBT4443272.1 aminomethyl-transferring glycine dehydrogenase [Oceanospirillaceae bacterium]MBT6078363.1 aminomethyl-transferring glycine dehydrogenase [Oceanospirillaceae bacterium]MBT7331521.1 aminomethyl-transferring glycine dehydrogenase [Oceanospirillaceae bacterium]
MSINTPIADLLQTNDFIKRHIGPNSSDNAAMLSHLQVASIDELLDQTVPDSIRLDQPLNLPRSQSEVDTLAQLKAMASKNTVNVSCIGMGYSNTLVPNVILRNVMENPAWYTAYTPYQPEIAQGRLEALLNYQQMVMDLTGMELANASLLDEATAAAEAMALCKRANKKKSVTFFVDENTHPQNLSVMRTRAEYFGFDIVTGNPATDLSQHDVFGVMVQYPGSNGDICDLKSIIDTAHEQNALVAVGADIMSLVLLKSPGQLGADVVFGSSQRFGVPLGFGGPHAAFFASKDKYKRSIPGRIIGVSIDTKGKPALRMAMQTREQHIRREKANSNICTAQALLANMSSFYAVYHGPAGLRTIANRIQRLTAILAAQLDTIGFPASNQRFFDTLTLVTNGQQESIYQRALKAGFNLRKVGDDELGISLDETTQVSHVQSLLNIVAGAQVDFDLTATDQLCSSISMGMAPDLLRQDAILEHPVFNSHHSETDMLRYLKKLENKDFSLVHGMIPLGSCTMKLNATAQMAAVTWPEFAHMHPFAPVEQTQGYMALIRSLEAQLVEITGYDRVSMQPNSGAQGEYAGLIAIRKYQASLGQGHRNICIIPSSSHGTNPASAAMVDMKVVVVGCDDLGNVNVDELRAKAEQHADQLSCLMITYPSTHGVYEESIVEICEIIHTNGGQVYMDGANMNAQVGISKPGIIGSDVSHLNLHKTFAIPHGGGGPGMGPIGVKSHLAPFLPNHPVVPVHGENNGNDAVSAAPYGSGSILPISWAYINLLGYEGLQQSTAQAIVNANYMASRLSEHFPILYQGRNDRVAHECIIDIRPLKETTGISEEDIAKRLMDYGFHAPTMSFPVAGTLMIEPTESEPKSEIDRFCDAMASIRGEIAKIEAGEWSPKHNPLKMAPHTQTDLASHGWNRGYSRTVAAFPSLATLDAKFWPTVNRIDNVYGDRNLVCSCPPMES